MSATIQKRHEYKVSRNGTFLGLLPDVQSDFTYNQNIGTAGAQLTVKVASSADTANLPANPILDETGAIITDEVGGSILEERAPDLVGDAADNILIRNDNDVEVYEFSSRYPNGILVFKGYIAKWKAVFGGDDDVTITVISHGQDLSHYLTPGGTADTLDQSQTQYNAVDSGLTFWETGANWRRFGQTFTTGAGVTNMSKITLHIGAGISQTATLKLWPSVADANAGTNLIATVSVAITGTGDPATFVFADYDFIFATLPTLTANTVYFFTIQAGTASDAGSSLALSEKDAGPYASGDMYRSLTGGAYNTTSTSGFDTYFKTYYSANSTVKTYTNSDPSTTLTALMNYYTGAGGDISKPAAGYSLTGNTPASTTFKLNTILEAIQVVLSLAPSDWFWYVDPATDVLQFKQAATTADHKLIKGRHIQKLELEATKEEIVNIVYFTGGPTAGTNLFVQVNDTVSLAANRRGMNRLSNNRVTDTTVGQLIANNYIDQHDEQTYITQVTVTDATYDISLFDLGEIVGFEGFGTLVDNLLLQIVGKTRNANNVTLSLGVLPPRQTALTDQLTHELADLQTIDNPIVPS